MISSDKHNQPHGPKYRPDIDGLRALAIIPVVLFHANLGFPGGFVGVDVFFVISGFLITSLISREIEAGTFELVRFWERRIRRILPALLVVVLVTLAAGWYFFLPDDFNAMGKAVTAQALMASNVFFWRNIGYFETDVDNLPLLHTWSLAVEEQFYLLFPLFLLLVARYKFVSVTRAIIILGVVSVALSVAGSYINASATFYLLPTRAWELLAGAFLAVAPPQRIASQRLSEGIGLFGLGLILYAVFSYTTETRFPGLAALPPCLGAAAIIFTGQSRPTFINRMLTAKALVFTGLISYSLYLWHWPLLVFSKYLGSPSPVERGGTVAASVVLAMLSWKYVETPVRRRLIFRSRRQIMAFGGGATVCVITLALIVYCSDGFPGRFPPDALAYSNARYHHAFRRTTELGQAMTGQFFEIGVNDARLPATVLVWGDSHAMAITPVLNDLCVRFSRRGLQATHSATPPLLDYACDKPFSLMQDTPGYNRAIFSYITKEHIAAVVLAAAWNGYPPTDSFKASMVSTVRALTHAGVKVYVFKAVPFPGFDVPRVAAIKAMHGKALDDLGVTRAQHQERNSPLDKTFEQIAQMGAIVLDASDYLLNERGIYGVIKNHEVLYWDSHHLTVAGSRLLAPLFEPIFQAATERELD